MGLPGFFRLASLARLINDLARAVIVWIRPSVAFCHADDRLSTESWRAFVEANHFIGERVMRRASLVLFGLAGVALMIIWGESLVVQAAQRVNAEIVERSNVYRKAVLDGNAAAVAAVFREDAVEMPPCQKMVQGRGAIEQFYRGMLSGPARVTGFTFHHMESSVVGEVAFDVGTYTRSVSTPMGAVEDSGKYTVVLKKTGGEWMVAYLIYNSDLPPQMQTAAH